MQVKVSVYMLILGFSSCQYLGIEQQQDAVTMTRIADTKYEKYINQINDCIRLGGGEALSAAQKKSLSQKFAQHESSQHQSLDTIEEAKYGSICASYTVGTMENEQVRRCRYLLSIYPPAAINYCLQQARSDIATIKTMLSNACKTAKDELGELTDEQIIKRLAMLPDYHTIKEGNCL